MNQTHTCPLLAIAHAAIGQRVGWGHANRCIAVSHALQDLGADVALVLERRDDKLTDLPSSMSLETHFTADRRLPHNLLKRLRSSTNPVAVLADTPEGSRFDFGPYMSVADIFGVCLNSYDGLRGQANLAFVRGVREHAGLRAEDDSTFVHAGHTYDTVRPCVVRARPQSPWTESRVHRIVITLGASDPDHVTEQLLEHLDVSDITLDVVIGPEFGAERTAALCSIKRRNWTMHTGVRDLTELLLSADLVVSLGGQTAYEAMCLGRPVACVRWEPMLKVIQRLSDEGLVIDLGEAIDAKANLKNLIHQPTRLATTARTGWLELDGQGAHRTAQRIIGAVRRADQAPPQEHRSHGESTSR